MYRNLNSVFQFQFGILDTARVSLFFFFKHLVNLHCKYVFTRGCEFIVTTVKNPPAHNHIHFPSIHPALLKEVAFGVKMCPGVCWHVDQAGGTSTIWEELWGFHEAYINIKDPQEGCSSQKLVMFRTKTYWLCWSPVILPCWVSVKDLFWENIWILLLMGKMTRERKLVKLFLNPCLDKRKWSHDGKLT